MSYSRVNWINEEEGTTTPLNAENLNTMDEGIADIDERVTELEDSSFVEDANYIHTDNNYTNEEKEKLSKLQEVSWKQNTTTGTKIAEITIGDKKTDVYAPTGGGGGGGASDWSELSNKPFESIDNDTLTVESGVLKANGDVLVVSTLNANTNEIEITSSFFRDDDALYVPLFEPTEMDSEGKYKVLTCVHEIIDTTNGKITITVSEAPTIDTRVAIQITKF